MRNLWPWGRAEENPLGFEGPWKKNVFVYMLVDMGSVGSWLWAPLPRFFVQLGMRQRYLTICALRFFSGHFGFLINGVGNNKMVPGVPFSFSSRGSLTLFTLLMNQSQPPIKSNSLCSRFQNTCGTAHTCVRFVLQNELVIPLMSFFTIQSFWESIIVLRCVLSFIYVYLRWLQPGRTNWQLLALSWKTKRQFQCRLCRDVCYLGAWYMKNALDKNTVPF